MLSINVEYSGLRDLQGRFQRLADGGADEAVAEGVRRVTERVYTRARENIRSLFRTSGKMENALQMTFEEAGARSRGSVSISGAGYITQEFGGTRPFAITPRKGMALLFEGEAGPVFTHLVLHPPLQARSYLRKALDDTRAELDELFAGPIRARLSQR